MNRTLTFLLAFVALALGMAATAGAAGVLVYKNDFKDRQDVGQIQKFQGGKSCGKSWKGKKALGVSSKGRRGCLLRTPVEADGGRPDHTIQAVAKVLKQTDKKVRRTAYIGLAVRAGKKTNYEMRVFPGSSRWELIKSGQVVDDGREKRIEALNKKNTLRLAVQGSTVIARANGRLLAKFRDAEPGEVGGKRTAVVIGNTANRKQDTVGLFDKVRILVPDPS